MRMHAQHSLLIDDLKLYGILYTPAKKTSTKFKQNTKLLLLSL